MKAHVLLFLYTAIKSQTLYWFTHLSVPSRTSMNVKSILILRSVQSNISFLKMGWKKPHFAILQASCFLSSSYQTPLKAIVLHYVSQFTPKRWLLTHIHLQPKFYKTHTRPFSKLTFTFWGNLQQFL